MQQRHSPRNVSTACKACSSVTSSEMMVRSPRWLYSKAFWQTVFAPRHLASLWKKKQEGEVMCGCARSCREHPSSCKHKPGDVVQRDHPPGLNRSIETVSADCLHGDDGHVCPAHILQALDDPAEEATSTHGHQHSSRLYVRSQRGCDLCDHTGVALPGCGGRYREVGDLTLIIHPNRNAESVDSD